MAVEGTALPQSLGEWIVSAAAAGSAIPSAVVPDEEPGTQQQLPQPYAKFAKLRVACAGNRTYRQPGELHARESKHMVAGKIQPVQLTRGRLDSTAAVYRNYLFCSRECAAEMKQNVDSQDAVAARHREAAQTEPFWPAWLPRDVQVTTKKSHGAWFRCDRCSFAAQWKSLNNTVFRGPKTSSFCDLCATCALIVKSNKDMLDKAVAWWTDDFRTPAGWVRVESTRAAQHYQRRRGSLRKDRIECDFRTSHCFRQLHMDDCSVYFTTQQFRPSSSYNARSQRYANNSNKIYKACAPCMEVVDLEQRKQVADRVRHVLHPPPRLSSSSSSPPPFLVNDVVSVVCQYITAPYHP